METIQFETVLHKGDFSANGCTIMLIVPGPDSPQGKLAKTVVTMQFSNPDIYKLFDPAKKYIVSIDEKTE